MFNAIRQQTKSFGTYILVVLLIVIFALFFGSPSGDCNAGRHLKLAKVGKTNIYSDDLTLIIGRAYGSSRNTPEAELLQQQANSLRLLITTYMLAENAYNLDLRVSDGELREYLTNPFRNREYGYYNRSGQFSGTLYKNYIQYALNSSIKEYEAFKRKELLATKYVDLLQMQGAVSDAEVEAAAKIKLTKVNLEFIKFDPKTLVDDVNVSDEQVANFLKDNEKEVKAYYDAHLSDYTKPEQISVQRIFISRPAPSEGDDAVDTAAKNWADARKRVLEDKEDFGAVAKALSQDFAKDKGGLIDYTDIDNIDQDIAKAVADAKPGDVKEITNDSSYMLVKLIGRKEKVVTPLANVKNEIAKKLIQEKEVASMTSKLVAQFQAAAQKGGDFEEVLKGLQNPPKPEVPADAKADAKDDKKKKKEEKPAPVAEPPNPWKAFSVQTTGDFTQTGRDLSSMFGGQLAALAISGPWDDVPNVGKSAELVKTAFTLTKEKPLIEKPLVVDGATFLFRLKSHTDPTPAELNDPAIRAQLISERLNPFMLPARGEFLLFAPLNSYGALIDATYFKEIKSGEIKLYNLKKWPAAPYLITAPPKVEEKKDEPKTK